jgi:hypothetical protein
MNKTKTEIFLIDDEEDNYFLTRYWFSKSQVAGSELE